MDEINNIASITGTYNEQILEMETSELSVPLINHLSIHQIVNKKAWATGNLTVTFIIDNQDTNVYMQKSVQPSFSKLIFTNVLNPMLIKLVTGSLLINEVPASYGTYTYSSETGLLSIYLNEIVFPAVITFQVDKRNVEVFRLENTGYISFADNLIDSNTVTVLGLSKQCVCKANQINLLS